MAIRFLAIRLPTRDSNSTVTTTAPARALGWVDEPAAEGVPGTQLRARGWALDPAGIAAVEIRCNGARLAARYGLPRSDVAAIHAGFPNGERCGFDFDADLAPSIGAFALPRQRVEFVAITRDGRETLIAVKSLIDPSRSGLWNGVAAPGTHPFQLLPALSGIPDGGIGPLEHRYRPYESDTIRVGMRVPILYLRTTKGADGDYAFDAEFDTARTSGGRRIADDSLAALLEAARKRDLPLLVTLNGGIWADASGSAPEWDINDALEEDVANCQWNERDEVMPDDMLKHLPGSQEAPELARALTLNVYASEVRRYKKRNLQQAAAVLVPWMRRYPGLFVGVNLDPDVYINPFFNEEQWYDYNPGTLRQFRHWLAGTGPYVGASLPGVPDLSAYRRADPLTLAEVARVTGRGIRDWDDVDPPRSFPRESGREYWNDPWVAQWERFRRHLVSLHYDDLARWLIEAGIPGERIWSSQGFIGTHPGCMPLALFEASPVKNYDSGGVSIAGSRPRGAHLGAILYGSAADNTTSTENGKPLHSILAEVDPDFAVVEFNTADLQNLGAHPEYVSAYRGLRDLWNAQASLVSPMAWNGSSGLYAGTAGYAAHTAWRDTPLEDAALDFLLDRAGLPRESRLWTFGSQRYADDDGWKAEVGHAVAGPGRLALLPDHDGRIVLASPRGIRFDISRGMIVILGLSVNAPLASIAIDAISERDGSPPLHSAVGIDSTGDGCLRHTAAGIAIAVATASVEPDTCEPNTFVRSVDQIRIELHFSASDPVGLARIAIVAAAPRPS